MLSAASTTTAGTYAVNLVFEKHLDGCAVILARIQGRFPFLPVRGVLERAIKMTAEPSYTARVFVDGIDRKKAGEMTNALRLRDITLELVRSRRDESESLIRLADMWAGCIRAALQG